VSAASVPGPRLGTFVLNAGFYRPALLAGNVGTARRAADLFRRARNDHERFGEGDRAPALCLTGTWSGQVREQGVEGEFLLNANIMARHGGR
jgi:hypothetical protein